MLLFVESDVLEVVVEVCTEAGVGEVVLSHGGESLLVEDILKMLEGQSELEDICIGGRSSLSLCRSSRDGECTGQGQYSGG